MDDAPSSFDIDACAAPATDGGVSPSMIPIPKIDPDELETAASDLRTAGENIEETAGDIKASWGALTPVYEAPEAETLLGALDPVTVDASDVATVTEDAAWALEGFAINARSIKQTLIDLKEEAEEFRAEVGWDDEWLDDEIHRATNNGINNRVAEAVQAYQEAERECANAIGAHYDGTLFSSYSDKARHDQTEMPGERNKELYGVSGDTLDQANPWGSSIAEPTGHMEDAMAGVGTFAVDFVVGVGMSTGVWRDGQAAYPFGTEWGENMGANWSDAQETFWAVLGSNAQGEWEDPGGWEAQWDNSQAALAEIGDSIVPVSEFDDRPFYTVFNGGLNVLSMLSPTSWIRVSGDTSGGFDAGTPDADGTGGDRGGQGTSPTTPGGAGGTDTVPWPDPPDTHPDLTSSLQSMDESLQRLEDQLGGGQGGAPDRGPGPGTEAPTPPATPEGPGPASPGDGNGAGSEGHGDGSSGTQTPAPTPHDGTPGEGGGGSSGSSTSEGGSGRGESDGDSRGEPGPDTRDGTDTPPRDGSDSGRREGSPDRSGTEPDPTSQGLRDGTRDTGADRSSDPWTTSPDGQNPSPEAPALRDPDEDGASSRSGDLGTLPPNSGRGGGSDDGSSAPVHIGPDDPLMPGPTERFGDGADLEPDRTYEITDSEGRSSTYFTDSNGKIIEIHTDARPRGSDHPELKNPREDAKYIVRANSTEYTYYTDSNRRTVRAEGELTHGSHDRNEGEQKGVNREAKDYFNELNRQIEEEFKADHDRKPRPGEVTLWDARGGLWNGGHLYGSSEFFGPGERLNQVAMLKEVNQRRVANEGIGGSFRNAEMTWDALLKGEEHRLQEILTSDYDKVMQKLAPALDAGPRPPKIETTIEMIDDPNLKPVTLPNGKKVHPPPAQVIVNWKVNGVNQDRIMYENLPDGPP